MGNDLEKNPLKVDTNATTVTWAGSGKLNIREIVWVGATDTHTLVLTINGVALTFTHLDALNGEEYYPFLQPLGWVNSFVVTSRGSGTVYIFLD
ncbi:hypothetical protein ES703_38389 [subsurface metagenome]